MKSESSDDTKEEEETTNEIQETVNEKYDEDDKKIDDISKNEMKQKFADAEEQYKAIGDEKKNAETDTAKDSRKVEANKTEKQG